MGNQGAKADCSQKQRALNGRAKEVLREANQKESEDKKDGLQESHLAQVVSSSF